MTAWSEPYPVNPVHPVQNIFFGCGFAALGNPWFNSFGCGSAALRSLHCNPSKSLRFAKILTTDGTDGTDFFE